MRKKKVHSIAIKSLTLLVVLGTACPGRSNQAMAQNAATPYPKMASNTDPAIWGANLPSSPVIRIADPLSHLTQFVIAVESYSDGTPAPSTAKHKH
jgi:hypothetical protein